MDKIKKYGFTLIEIVIAIVVMSIILAILSRTTWFVRTNVVRESAELQNLEVARIAVNYIRRDFMLSSPDLSVCNNFAERYAVLRHPVVKKGTANGSEKPIEIDEKSISLYKRVSDLETDGYEHITYKFDIEKNKLVRESSKYGEKSFDGIKNAKFAIYYLSDDLNYSNTPYLWVYFTVENGIGDNKKELSLTATIASNAIIKNLLDTTWNEEG